MADLRWKANYVDGTFFISEGKPGSGDYNKIDRQKLQSFEMIDDNNKTIYKLNLGTNEKVVCRRRTWQDFHSGEILGYVWMVGLRKRIKVFYFWHKIIENISYVFSDGHIESASEWAGGNPEYRRDEDW